MDGEAIQSQLNFAPITGIRIETSGQRDKVELDTRVDVSQGVVVLGSLFTEVRINGVWKATALYLTIL